MHASTWSLAFWGSLTLTTLAVAPLAQAQESPPPPPRAIPGITAADSFPQGCVSCHVVLPDGRDVRISAFMQRWTVSVDSSLLAKAKAVSPPDAMLEGRHPEAAASTRDIPAGCLKCHGKRDPLEMPFAKLMHLIHLTSDAENIYMTAFQGECTYCHKLDLATGTWSIPSGPEP